MNNSTNPVVSSRRRLVKASAACALLAIGLGMSACSDEEGSGDIVTLSITDVVDPEVTAVTVYDDFDVHITVDPNAPLSASIQIDDNLINDTDFWVDDDGELFVGWGSLVDVEPTQRPVITMSVHEFDSVDNRSEGSVTVTGVDNNDFDVRTHGDGAVEVNGTAARVDVDVSGESTVDLANLVADRVDLLGTGDGTLSVHATVKLTGEVTDDGDVRVLGNPDTSQVDIDGDVDGELIMV